MTENGVVCEVKDNQRVSVIIEATCGENCLHCTKSNKREIVQALNKSGTPLYQGDRVEIYISPGKAILTGFLIFIVPLVLFIVFYMAGKTIFNTGDSLVSFLFGVAGVAAGFLFNIGVGRRRKESDYPEIIRVVDSRVQSNTPGAES